MPKDGYAGSGPRRCADAEDVYTRALAILDPGSGRETPVVTESLNNLAELYRIQRRNALAEPLYRRSLSIREQALGPEHPSVATSLDNLAAFYHGQGRNALQNPRRQQVGQKGPDARRRPMAAREAQSLYVERAVEGANESDGPLSATCRVGAGGAFTGDEGHRTKAIAAKLNLSVKTAETHPTQLMQRLDIHDVAGLVRYAFRVGLIHPGT